MIESAEEFIALRTSEDPLVYARAAHEPASEELWCEVIENYPEMRVWVAQNKTVPLTILEVLAQDPDVRVRDIVARKRKLTPTLFERLARDPDSGVRLAVARNRSAPQFILQLLENDPWDRIAQVAKERIESEFGQS